MSGEIVLAIVTAICTCVVTVTTIIVRTRNGALLERIELLTSTVASAHALILSQNTQIQDLTAQKNVAIAQNVSDNKKSPIKLE